MTRLSLALLGPLQVVLDGAPIAAFESDKVRALLAYLVVEAERPHRRDALAGLLWPDRPERAAHLNLNQALANLRGAIGDRTAIPPSLHITRDTVQFNRASDYELDVEAFTSRLAACDQHRHRHLETCTSCIQRLRQAADLYRGSFLAQFFLSDSAAFEEWALLKRERLQRRALHALVRLADYHERRGEYEQTQHYTWRQLELEPWREESHRQLMRVFALSGQRSTALEQYERCRRVLADELGVEPAEETTALYERIRDTASAALSAQRDETQHVQNFPAQATALIGRAAELAELGALFENPACRLITIVGPGGIGKTRLALAAATEQAETFTHGAVFVPLAAISAAAFVAPAILAALDIPLHGQRAPREQLLEYLREKELLLVLDNVEQLLAHDQSENDSIADLLSAILARAPSVTLLVTSRERLALLGEWLFDLSGLSYPTGEPSADFESYNAVQLFMQRARQVRRQFALVDGEARAVARICQLVEGLPLAIELAAAALRTRSCMAIAAAIESNRLSLAIELRGIPERQRSIWATFEHSWRLLSDEERQLLARLSVFRGGFEEDSSAHVAQASPELLRALVDKSLLRWDGVARYDMHELVRQYAGEKLEQTGESDRTRHQHLAFFLGLAEAAELQLSGVEQRTWLRRLEVEHDNQRAALAWTFDGGDIAAGVRLAGALAFFWEWRGHLSEGRRWLETALARTKMLEHVPGRAKAIYGAGLLAGDQGDLVAAQALMAESIPLFRALGNIAGIADAHGNMGNYSRLQGDYAAARAHLQECLALFRGLGDRSNIAAALDALSTTAWSCGDYPQAAVLAEEALALQRELNDSRGVAYALHSLGDAMRELGAYAHALALLEESLTICQALEDIALSAHLHISLGHIALDQADYPRATSLYQDALVLFRKIGIPGGLALQSLGRVALAQGNIASAIALLERSVRLFRDSGRAEALAWALLHLSAAVHARGDNVQAAALLCEALILHQRQGNRHGIARSLQIGVQLAAVQGQPLQAARLCGTAEVLREAVRAPLSQSERPAYDRAVAAIHAQLDDEAFATAWAEGQAMPLEQAVAYALEASDRDSTSSTATAAPH